MSFAVDDRGRAFVLDQVNSRVEVFGAEQPRSIPLPADTYQDVVLTRNSGLAVLDRLVTQTVAYVDGEGRTTHEIALVGQGVPEGGDVTALFQRDDGTWVEVKHQNLVRIADADGNALEDREIVQGRFGANGVLRASKRGDHAVFLAQKRPGVPAEALAKLTFQLGVWQVLSLETDAQGRIALGVSLIEESPTPPFDLVRAEEAVVLLAPNGAELSRITLPASTGPEESFRRIRLGADGVLYHLAYQSEGVTLRRVRL
ncbi:MAG: hypothetical protein R3B13_05305 [Polyangiaceae bacterium]